MAKQFASFDRAADAACLVTHTGGTTEGIMIHTAVDVHWDTFGTTTIAEDTQATSLPGGTPNVDTLTVTWLLVATTAGGLYLIDQKYQATSTGIATLIPSGDYAVWARIVDGRVENFEQ